MLKQESNSKFGNIFPSSSPVLVLQYEIILFDLFSMKTTLPAAYFKNRFNRVSNCAITQDICTRLLGLLYAFVYQSYNKRVDFTLSEALMADRVLARNLPNLNWYTNNM